MYLIYLCFDSGVIKEHFFFLKIKFSNLKLYLHLGLTSKQFQWRISSAYFGMGIIVFFYVLCKVTMITWQFLENPCRVEILLTCRYTVYTYWNVIIRSLYIYMSQGCLSWYVYRNEREKEVLGLFTGRIFSNKSIKTKTVLLNNLKCII